MDYLQNCPSLRRLCGWETVGMIPSESTFSRAFATFASFHLPEKIHAAMITENLAAILVGHISRDATAIPAREKLAVKPIPAMKVPKKRGRPTKDQPLEPKQFRRLEIQPQRSQAENLTDLPTRCDHGCKRNAQGFTESWIGYKLHLDVADGDIPISAILTSASLHDSQAVIPLAQQIQELIDYCYDLMDATYDAEKIPMDPRTARRFKQRSCVKRVNSQLKDNFGALFVRVRGAAKVMCHLMFGVLACTAIQLLHCLPITTWAGPPV